MALDRIDQADQERKARLEAAMPDHIANSDDDESIEPHYNDPGDLENSPGDPDDEEDGE